MIKRNYIEILHWLDHHRKICALVVLKTTLCIPEIKQISEHIMNKVRFLTADHSNTHGKEEN